VDYDVGPGRSGAFAATATVTAPPQTSMRRGHRLHALAREPKPVRGFQNMWRMTTVLVHGTTRTRPWRCFQGIRLVRSIRVMGSGESKPERGSENMWRMTTVLVHGTTRTRRWMCFQGIRLVRSIRVMVFPKTC
jgi:hypothetical protein